MKIGDYVRIKNTAGWSCIGKIIDINNYSEPNDKYCIDIQRADGDYIFIPEDMIVKSSSNIIDLIEVGDYVNGFQVLDIAEAPERVLYLNDISQKGALIPRVNIKSIVTKEQFESMEYKVGVTKSEYR